MRNDISFILLILVLFFCGVGVIYLAYFKKKVVEYTLGAVYKSVSMEVLEVNITPNYLYGGDVAGPLDERTSMVSVRYKYLWNSRVYESCRVFPLEVEWVNPRISSFSLFEDLKAKRLNRCFVDSSKPPNAILFRGWSPFLKRHVIGLFVSGFLILSVCIVIAYFLFFGIFCCDLIMNVSLFIK